MKELVRQILQAMDPPEKSKALPYLRIKQLTANQLQEIGSQVSPGKKVPFSHTDIQNWVKRGFLARTNRGAKLYTSSEAANLLLFADLKDVLGLDGAGQFMKYINGDPTTTTDDLLDPNKIYEYYAQVYDATAGNWKGRLNDRIDEAHSAIEAESLIPENKQKLITALVVLSLVAQADFYREMALEWLKDVQAPNPDAGPASE